MPDDHHEFDSNVASPPEDMVVARRVFEEGDLEHAAYHVASAISVDPREEYVAFIDELMQPNFGVGDFAPWIAPPARGIHRQPLDFEYVKLPS